jgi:hypothetical protein
MSYKTNIKKVTGFIRGLFPQRVPQGLTEFSSLIDALISTYNPPMERRSVEFTVATLLQRLNPTQAYVSQFFYYRSLTRGAAAQVAFYVMDDIKNKQKAEHDAAIAAEAAKLAEASAPPVVSGAV